MSEIMRRIPADQLVKWVMTEAKESGSIFGVKKSKFYKAHEGKTLEIFGEKMETPFGPAAGPQSQLAQNIIASYIAGARFFEVKTVQGNIDGKKMQEIIQRPCITAPDECYNVEWSTELYVQEALDEYIKGYVMACVVAKEFGLGDSNAFIYNMSVGYSYEEIVSKKIDDYIEGLRDASKTQYFKDMIAALKANVGMFQNVDEKFIDSISPNICNSITLSTLHGCPASDIEKIAHYLITEKKMNTFIKCNPTILGYETARSICDKMGFGYLSFDDHHFKADLQFAQAVELITRLKAEAKKLNLEFGVKLTNTFPVRIENKELPGEEMYMSGRSLYPLSIMAAHKLASAFNGDLRISFSGGADAFNVEKIFDTGIWPITLATTVLKPGGYARFNQLAKTCDKMTYHKFAGINLAKLEKLVHEIDPNHLKSKREVASRKINKTVPLVDCYIAPCKNGCPINQDVPEYISLVGQKKYAEAMKVITERNVMPFTTGVLCAHPCMTKCTRIDYDESVNIRGEKLLAANEGYHAVMKDIKAPTTKHNTKVAIIGGGPAGLAAGYFLTKNGYQATVFETKARMGGVMGNVVPQFRITDEQVDKDIALAKAYGCEFKNNVSPDFDVNKLKAEGYKYIYLAIGACKASNVELTNSDKHPLNVITFLEHFRASNKLNIGKNVAIIGAGNSAMDAARAAKRVEGVENVFVVYRRTKDLAPAEKEEIHLAEQEGVKFFELTAPVSHNQGILKCEKMRLGERDASGRRSPVATGEFVELAIDTVVAAIGEKVETSVIEKNGIALEKGWVKTNEFNETSIANVFIGGDALNGPATIVQAMADGIAFADEVIRRETNVAMPIKSFEDRTIVSNEKIQDKKAILAHACKQGHEHERCLECNYVCEICAEVCPNRANVAINVEGFATPQIIHLDPLCNECGNCETFCPYSSAPYIDKFTYYSHEEDFAEVAHHHRQQDGFLFGEGNKVKVRLDGKVYETTLDGHHSHDVIPAKLYKVMEAFKKNYSYMLMS